MDHGGSRARRLLGAALVVAAHEREAADLDVDGVGDVDVGAAHDGDEVQCDLAAVELRVAEIDVVTAHDRNNVHGAVQPEPPAPTRSTHDSYHPANRVPPHARYIGLAGEITRQGLQFAASLRDERTADSFLQLIEG